MNENCKTEELDVIKSNSNASDFLINLHEFKSNNNKSQNNNEEQINKISDKINNKLAISKLSRNMYYIENSIQNKKTLISSSTTSIPNSRKVSNQEQSSNNPILVVNTLSPSKKKKINSFKMIEKSKYKTSIDNTKKNENEFETITGKERTDAFGNVIKRKNKKKIKVSFVDEINKEQPLVNFIDIECYKKFNVIIGMPKEEHNKKNHSNCQCCNIF